MYMENLLQRLLVMNLRCLWYEPVFCLVRQNKPVILKDEQ